MLKSLAKLLVTVIPTTEPAPEAFDVAALTCDQYTQATDASRLTALKAIGRTLGRNPPSDRAGSEGIEELLFRVDLTCLNAPDALVRQILADRQRPRGTVKRG